MKHLKQVLLLSALLGVPALSVTGCGDSAGQSSAPAASGSPVSSPAVQSVPEAASQPEAQQVTLYTGWDLTLSDEVTAGKGGITVSFAGACALFSGPPEPPKEESFVYDAKTLVPTVLDSVRETLHENFVDSASGGGPNSLSIYCCSPHVSLSHSEGIVQSRLGMAGIKAQAPYVDLVFVQRPDGEEVLCSAIPAQRRAAAAKQKKAAHGIGRKERVAFEDAPVDAMHLLFDNAGWMNPKISRLWRRRQIRCIIVPTAATDGLSKSPEAMDAPTWST